MSKDFSGKFFPKWDSWDPSHLWTAKIPGGDYVVSDNPPKSAKNLSAENAEEVLMTVLIMLYAVVEADGRPFNENELEEFFDFGNWEQLQDAGLNLLMKAGKSLTELRRLQGREGFPK